MLILSNYPHPPSNYHTCCSKIFTAGILRLLYDFEKVKEELRGYEEVLVSPAIDNIRAKTRSHIMNRMIKDIALYGASVGPAWGKFFLTVFLKLNKYELSSVFAAGLAYNEQIGRLILEFNIFSSQLNNCKADNVIDCIVAGTINK